MKKIIMRILIPILIVFCFFSNTTIKVNAYDENSIECIGAYYSEDDIMLKINDYEDNVVSDWDQIKSFNYSTDELINIILSGKEFSSMYLFDDIQKGISYLKNNNLYFKELLTRNDYKEKLIQKYQNINLITATESEYLQNYWLEIILSQNEIIEKLSPLEYNNLLTILNEKSTMKNILIDYEYDENIFFILANNSTLASMYSNAANDISQVSYFSNEIPITPNGNIVSYAEQFSGSDLTDTEIENLCALETNYSNVVREDYPTKKYNCHSYAWYSQDYNTNMYWIHQPYSYIFDESYEICTSNIDKSDILCYFAVDCIAQDGYLVQITEPYIAHSAIITSVGKDFVRDDINTYDELSVISKWGMSSLLSHNAVNCPYTDIMYDSEQGIYTVPYGYSVYTPKTNASYTLSDSSSQINETATISLSNDYTNNYEMYELNITDSKSYEFNISSTSGLDVRLYDEHMQLVEYDNLDVSTPNNIRFVKYLDSRKTYYLRIAYANKESTGTISTTIQNPCQGCHSLYRERVALNCQTEPFEDSLYLQQNQPIIYELDLECNTRYEFEVVSPNLLSVGLYDENMTLLADFLYYKETNNNYYYFNIQDLEEGRYHIKIELASESLDCDIQVTLGHRPTSPEEILVNQPVDVLEHLHYNQNSYYFMRNRPGIYEVVLTGTSSNGTLVYPEGTITIVSGDNVVQKYVFTKGDYDNPATSLYGSNTMTWLVDDYASYYINIDIHSTGLTSLQLEVRELETFSLSASDEYSKSSPLISGDKFEILNVERTGEYKVKAIYTGNQVEDMLFVILRKNSEGLFEEIDGGLVNNTSDFETNVILNTHEQIYIGYFNGKGSGTFSLNIDRNVSNTFSLMTDPNSNVIVGSEVSLNNGVYGGTTLTQGYTRIVYLGIDAPYIESRTQYNWYTTDSSVAIVSSFGTVTATATWTGSQTYKTVTIRAVYKNDITVVGEIELTVYKDPNANSTTKKILQYYGMDVRGDGTTGTEVSQNGGSKIEIGYMPEVTITKGYTRYICLGADSPSNIIQHFTWSVNRQTGETGNASVSQYGTITAISEGYITIKGVYKYNPQYEIYITIKVV